MSNLLSVEKLTMKFGGLIAIDDLSLMQKKIKSLLLSVLMELEKLQSSIA